VEFVAATFLRHGKKQLDYCRAEREWDIVLCVRLQCFCCVVSWCYIRLCPHIMSATLFHLICIPSRYRIALHVYVWRVLFLS
jgi:hypothetical protein